MLSIINNTINDFFYGKKKYSSKRFRAKMLPEERKWTYYKTLKPAKNKIKYGGIIEVKNNYGNWIFYGSKNPFGKRKYKTKNFRYN